MNYTKKFTHKTKSQPIHKEKENQTKEKVFYHPSSIRVSSDPSTVNSSFLMAIASYDVAISESRQRRIRTVDVVGV